MLGRGGGSTPCAWGHVCVIRGRGRQLQIARPGGWARAVPVPGPAPGHAGLWLLHNRDSGAEHSATAGVREGVRLCTLVGAVHSHLGPSALCAETERPWLSFR